MAVKILRNPPALQRFTDIAAGMRHRMSSGSSSLYEEHLRRVFPHSDEPFIKNTLSTYWKTHERNLLALFFLADRKKNDVLERVAWRNRDLLDKAVERGMGVLLLVPHYGDERGLHVILGMAGYTVHVVTSRYSDMPVYCRKCRLAPGEKWNIMHFPDENPRWMYRTLQAGGIIHYGSTAYGGPGGTWISSFGVPVLVPSAPWKLWKRTGCSVLQASCSHTPGMGWEISLRNLSTPADRKEFAAAAGAAAEELARSNPGQYEWKNLAIRHRESNTIARIGRIPVDERELEQAALPEDGNPETIHLETAFPGF